MFKKAILALCLAAPMLAQQSGPTGSAVDSFGSKPSPADYNKPYPDPVTIGGTTVAGVKGGSVKPEPWPEGTSFVEDKSLPLDVGLPNYGEDFSEANARRTFAFKVQPGEKLEFNLKGEEEKVVMRVHVPTPPPALKWKMELMFINKIARPRRTKHLEIKNPTSEVQTLYLIVYGVKGYSYHLEMARSGEAKKG